MNQSTPPVSRTSSSYRIHVFAAGDMDVVSGANHGDTLGPLDDLCLGDIYQIQPKAIPYELSIIDPVADQTGSNRFLTTGASGHQLGAGSELGSSGDGVRPAGRLTFMASDGGRVELLLIELVGADGAVGLCFLPLEPVEPKVSYTLLEMSEDVGEVRLTDITPVAFTRGTSITLADGTQCQIERLRVGDRVLTRDHGPQPVRWIGNRTVRAIGPYAPVVITKGTLSNESDMIVSQNQRLFIYQRGTNRLSDTAELLIKARDLVDGERVYIRRGGFVEYFHLLFDTHEIIYAECTPTESMLANDRTLGQLPEDLLQEVTDAGVKEHDPHFGTEADKTLLAGHTPDTFYARRKPKE